MKTKRDWNPNYLAYAKSKNLTPEACMAKDTEEYPGGKMTGFILWMSQQTIEFDKINRPADTYHQPTNLYNPHQKFYIRDSKALSIWIQKKYL